MSTIYVFYFSTLRVVSITTLVFLLLVVVVPSPRSIGKTLTTKPSEVMEVVDGGSAKEDGSIRAWFDEMGISLDVIDTNSVDCC